jgi:beta-1,4-mannosyl-glycoprotein beta-1,4-N-acetylglucosaminyltransferase
MNIQCLRQSGHEVIDVFPFFNELELLELRLRILSPFVDKFVLVECPQTFSGLPKPLYFASNQSLFNSWREKIVHYVITDPIESVSDIATRLRSPEISPVDRWILEQTAIHDTQGHEFHWTQEFFQRESIRKAIGDIDREAIIFFSDLDEIWNPQMRFEWNSETLFRLEQKVFCYWLNNQSNEPWSSAIFGSSAIFEGRSLNHLRADTTDLQSTKVSNGGWHFTYQGGQERIKMKLSSFSHQEFNNRKILRKLGSRLANRTDILGRSLKFEKSEVGLPPEIFAMRHKLPDWFL